jgi:NADH-quinone oxidoreductase subunit E
MSNPRAVDPATQLIEPDKAFPGAASAGHAGLVALPPGFEAAADELMTHYPVSKRSASLPLLLELQPINILELVTFYPMFRQHPIGRIQIKVCRTLSCALSGSYALCDHFREKCGTAEPDAHGIASSPDGKYAVEFVECIASCGTAPVIMINDDFHESVTPARADELLRKYD